MRKQNILRMLLFAGLFSIGAAVLSASILSDELLQYYTNKQLLEAAKQSLNRLKSLITDYDLLLQQLEEDPNLVKHIAPATLGVQPADANAVYPRVTNEQIAAVRKALSDNSSRKAAEPTVPAWLTQCSKPWWKIVLFVVGGLLILISFICFGPAKQTGRKQ